MQWKRPCSPPPKKFCTQPSASKVMATVFWDSKGIILIDYKPAGTSVTGEYYANVIKQLRIAIKEKRRAKLAAGVLLLHDNASVHKSRVAQVAIRECKFEQLNLPPYSPDLAPRVYYLFQNLKSHLLGTRFLDDDELKAATEAWFENQIDDFYFKGIDCLKAKVCQMHWSKGGLYWKIMLKPSSNLWVKPRVLWTYWTPLVLFGWKKCPVWSYVSCSSIQFCEILLYLLYSLCKVQTLCRQTTKTFTIL